jgi:putative two-component system response regulator
MNELAHAVAGTLSPRMRPALQLVSGDRPLAEPGRVAPTHETCGLLRLVPSRETPTVLVADADEETLELLSFHLGSSFDVIQASDGEEALRLALVCTPDAILLDVRMPTLDGYEVTRLLRGHAATRETPVILLDTHPERIDTLRGYAVGADDYLTKPLDPARIVARVVEALA